MAIASGGGLPASLPRLRAPGVPRLGRSVLVANLDGQGLVWESFRSGEEVRTQGPPGPPCIASQRPGLAREFGVFFGHVPARHLRYDRPRKTPCSQGLV